MEKNDWKWLSKQELECLLKVEEYDENEVIKINEKDTSRFKVQVDVLEGFEIPEAKKLVLVSYSDTKREFETIYDLLGHFSDNPYLRNTVHNDGKEEYKKIRSRFFMVPINFSKLCLLLIGKMCHPELQNLTISEIVSKLKQDLAQEKSTDDKLEKSNEVRNKIEDDL